MKTPPTHPTHPKNLHLIAFLTLHLITLPFFAWSKDPPSTSLPPTFAWTLTDLNAILGVSLGESCDSAAKTLGKTKYRFSYKDTKVIAYNHQDHAMDLDFQCQSDKVVSISLRRLSPKSRFFPRLESDLLTRATTAEVLLSLGEPKEKKISPSGASTFYYCTSTPHGVLALHFDASGSPLQQVLLIDDALLSATQSARLGCLAPPTSPPPDPL